MTTYTPPVPTYTALQTITLGSTASSVTFSNIPNTYRDLVLTINGAKSQVDGSVWLRFNGDSGTNYFYVYALGDGSSTSSGSGPSTGVVGTYLSTQQAVLISQIMDYSATDKHKTVLTRRSIGQAQVLMGADRWANMAAINSIAVVAALGTINSGTTLSLYGIAA